MNLVELTSLWKLQFKNFYYYIKDIIQWDSNAHCLINIFLHYLCCFFHMYYAALWMGKWKITSGKNRRVSNAYFLWKSEYSQKFSSKSECSDTKNRQSFSVNGNSKITTFWEVATILIHATWRHLMSFPHHKLIFFYFLVGKQRWTDMLLPRNYQNWSTSILMAAD